MMQTALFLPYDKLYNIKNVCLRGRRSEVDNIDEKVGKGCIACGSFKFDGGTIKYSIIIKYQE